MPALTILRALLSRVRLPYLAILLLACTLLQTAYAQSFTISTVAGNGNYGYNGDGVAATSANLANPSGVALDSAGNLTLTDTSNNRVRKVSASTGAITTVAGNGSPTFSGDGGLATSAGVYHPRGLAMDSVGNFYFSEASNSHRIRKVAVGSGLISTVAGSADSGFAGDGGPATSARLNVPMALAFDSAGNLYIADSWNNRIRKVTAVTGLISTVAGNGTAGFSGDGGAATNASLNYPKGVTVDNAGNLYIGDASNCRIRKVTASTGLISTVAGNGTCGYSGDGGLATSASLYGPYGSIPQGLALDGAGNLYFADSSNNRIRKVAASTGFISTVAGNGAYGFTGDGGPATSASFYSPTGLAIDSAGNLYVADITNNRIRKLTANIASQSISFGAAPSTTVVGFSFSVSATASSGLAVTFSSLTTGICTVSGSTVTGIAAGTCTVAADQAGNASYSAAPQVTQSFSVTAVAPASGDLITYLQNYDLYSTTTLGGVATRLTTSGKVFDQRISPDRSKIAYTQAIVHGSSYDIRIMNADGSGSLSIGTKTQGNHIWGRGLSFSPDGSSLVYSSGDGLWKVGVNGTGKTLLAANPSGRTWREVDWSANGKIVAQSIGGWGYTSEIRIMNADGSNPIIIVPDAPGGLSGVRFAPDGQSIMYVYDVSGYEDSGGGQRDTSIFVAGIDGSNSINISQASGKVSGTNDYMGTASPDGKRILFSSCQNGIGCSQMVMNRDGTQRQTVLAISSALGGDAAGMIDWRGTSAVTGDLITYLQNYDLYSTTTLGGVATRLTTSGKVFDQRISPDRSKIAYTQAIVHGSSYDIRIMNADGSGSVSIGTKTQGNHIWGRGLSFSPDGSSLVYSSGDGLWKVGVNGTGKTLLAANPSGRTWREVDWSVNGKIVAGSIGGWGYTSEIRIMNADGSNPTIIVPDAPGGLSGVRFAPDGQSIMYVYDVSGYEDSGGGPRDNSIFVAGIDGSSSINISQASGKVSGTNDYMGTVSPDGKRILFSSCLVTLPCSQMVMNRDGTQRQTVLAISSALGGDAAGMIDWRGTSAVTGDLITYLQNGDVYSTTTLGGTATRLTTSGKVIDQRISPDRSKIAYTQEISAGSSYDVRIMNADGSGAVSVGTKTQGNHIWGSGLSFSPDGSSLAYSSGDGLWKVGVNGTGKTLLAASPSGRTWREVDWSANGKIVAQSIAGWAYTSEIRIMNADGSNPTIIVPDAPGALHGVRFAPDGQSIFYNYDVSGHEESSGRQIDTSIFVAGIDGSNPVNLSQASGRVSGTRDYVDALSPNGTRILFTNCQDNIGCSMMVMNRDGTQRQTVIAGTASLSISVEGVDWRGATIATTITFGAMPVVTVGGTGTGTVSATSTSGLPVTFSSLTTPVCTVSGSTVTGIAAGICTLAANQSGNGTYAAAPQATLSFSIAASIVPPGPPTITSIKAGSGSATLNFSAPGNTGGSPISSYMASCTATGRTTRTATGTSSPISVGNLTGGVIYQCTLTATNGGGLSSAASAAMPVTAKKNSITPILMLLLD